MFTCPQGTFFFAKFSQKNSVIPEKSVTTALANLSGNQALLAWNMLSRDTKFLNFYVWNQEEKL